ncbi:MAG: hypothetical protein BWX50_00291 [Euryarchaeota archaeon ADurb.Bin009]|nr:MAG: hypothetical protein BWX50_00291 [Euryarchaeota archaeon ADurb.Bin009]
MSVTARPGGISHHQRPRTIAPFWLARLIIWPQSTTLGSVMPRNPRPIPISMKCWAEVTNLTPARGRTPGRICRAMM